MLNNINVSTHQQQSSTFKLTSENIKGYFFDSYLRMCVELIHTSTSSDQQCRQMGNVKLPYQRLGSDCIEGKMIRHKSHPDGCKFVTLQKMYLK